jgi:hypothetical protein
VRVARISLAPGHEWSDNEFDEIGRVFHLAERYLGRKAHIMDVKIESDLDIPRLRRLIPAHIKYTLQELVTA